LDSVLERGIVHYEDRYISGSWINVGGFGRSRRISWFQVVVARTYPVGDRFVRCYLLHGFSYLEMRKHIVFVIKLPIPAELL